jgi:endonuclease YncB( thermonuclease family)
MTKQYHESKRTPMYIVLSDEGKKRSIELVPVKTTELSAANLVQPPSRADPEGPLGEVAAHFTRTV